MTLASSVLPAWAVIPPAGGLMVLLAGHILNLRQVRMDEGRRRTRLAGAWVMLLLTPTLAVLFGIASRSTPLLFTGAFGLSMVLLSVLVCLAGMDAWITSRLHREAKQEIGAQLKELRELAERAREEAKRQARRANDKTGSSGEQGEGQSKDKSGDKGEGGNDGGRPDLRLTDDR